ncbi:helix-turn-helix domain-containing protein [Halobacteria archaeon AArc-m2/3/4]|uniref:Helix-turn-helix domain-containing protein n=1 Tax=Natronoglomus mannanivorans TaxID=2979990 RepID=A0AAP3E0I1_9EURY|nr:helix-turn-helix domain-containing protein [Halobacteria archaeon AArc-xg1-1]MCU4971400.1 helix-turn-helix domain-containing protein [Halobacteria archaeon AArc-m2/3/4]
MASDDTDEDRVDDADGPSDDDFVTDDSVDIDVDVEDAFSETGVDVELEGSDHDRGVADGVDQRIVDLLSWILDTETRAKIYVHLLASPGSTSEEVAKGTGLYPSTVREALAELHDEEKVTRRKRASEGAGNNPYEYMAIQPSELVGGVVDQVQHELNTIFTLDRVLDRESGDTDDEFDDGVEPVTITVDDDSESDVDREGDETLEDDRSALDDDGDGDDNGIDDNDTTVDSNDGVDDDRYTDGET